MSPNWSCLCKIISNATVQKQIQKDVEGHTKYWDMFGFTSVFLFIVDLATVGVHWVEFLVVTRDQMTILREPPL